MFDRQLLLRSLGDAFAAEYSQFSNDAKTVSNAYTLLGTLKTILVSCASYSYVYQVVRPSASDALAFFENLSLLSPCFDKGISNDSASLLIDSLPDEPFDDACLCDLHQWLICIDVALDDDGIFTLGISKNPRDASGSYYTPSALSAEVAEHAFEMYIEKYGSDAIRKPCRIADLSCGAGEFLVAALSCPSARRLLSHIDIWAYDVDPSALIIAFSRVARFLDLGDSRDGLVELASGFVLGNPLVSATGELAETTRSEKELSYYLGLLYSEATAIDANLFPDEGFNVVLGNPPWEKIRFEDRKFFDLIAPEIAAIPNKNKREMAIAKLAEHDERGICSLYDLRSESYKWFKESGRPDSLKAIGGEPNTYVLFIQAALDRVANRYVVAQIVKSALMTAPAHASYSGSLIADGRVSEVHMFSNRRKLFPIDARERFCALFLSEGVPGCFSASFGNMESENFSSIDMVRICQSDLETLNPQTKTMVDLDSNDEYSLLLDMQCRFGSFENQYPLCHFGRLVHLTTHAQHISLESNNDSVGVFEGKFIGRHDSRYSTFAGIPESDRYRPKVRSRVMSDLEKRNSGPECRYYIDKEAWREISKNYVPGLMLCWRSLTSATNSRTMIATLCEFQPACQSVQFLQIDSVLDLCLLAGLFNSKAFDYILRKKIPGIDLTQAVIKQMPVPPKESYRQVIEFQGVSASVADHILLRLRCLYENDKAVANELEKIAAPRYLCMSREAALNDLDDLYCLAYGFSKEEKRVVRAAFA